ncbi:MAG: hypothetical protein SFY68_07605 [Candidatus Sumerlaeia bacterium]|nr:hypothetical protein [Candidatus Sumerlaeia bacterium]
MRNTEIGDFVNVLSFRFRLNIPTPFPHHYCVIPGKGPGTNNT